MTNLAYVRHSSQLIPIECGACGGVYAIAESYYDHKYDTDDDWNCPYCQSLMGWGAGRGGRIAKLEREKARLEREKFNLSIRLETTRADLTHAKHQTRAEKGAKTKLKKRSAAGVCLHCKRSFKQLHHHMRRQHPEECK